MHSVADLYAIWPNDAELARDIGMPYPTVSSWKQRDSIPVPYWRDIISAAHTRGHPEITAEVLVNLHAREREPSPDGFQEDEMPYQDRKEAEERGSSERSSSGHFSRWKHLRRSHFATLAEVNDHIAALREEWGRR